jgi:nitroreductase
MTPDDRRRILDSGVRAPSGDNLQPWIVDSDGQQVRIAVDPGKDRSLYNFQYRASLIAVGAMIENMVLAARESGLATEVDFLPPPEAGGLPSARLAFNPAGLAPDPLFAAIAQRCTNRRPYSKTPVSADKVQALRQAAGTEPARLLIVQDRAAMRTVARAASLNDRLLYELRTLHDEFYQTLRWTREEVEATRDGLDVRTLELGPMGPGFKAMRSWPVVRVLNLFGSSRMAPMHSYRTFLQSGAFGFLQMSAPEGAGDWKTWIEGGRRLQRIWLTATRLGLAFQPMAGMLYLLAYREAGVGSWSGSQRALLARAERLFGQVLPLEQGAASILLFRFGQGGPPSATSLRRAL